MFRNYLKTAIRSLRKNKGFTAINIFGLALGLAACLLITLYVVDELSYDHYNTKYERIYRVNTDLKYGGAVTKFAIAAPPVGAAMVREFPEVERSARLALAFNVRFKKGSEIVEENHAIYCDPDIFDIFTLPMIAGTPSTALKEPNTIVISEKAAKKYFNTTDVIGKTITKVGVDGNTIYKITGVIRDIPAESHFKADFLFGLDANQSKGWNNFTFNTYILLRPGADPKRLEAKFDGLLRRHISTKAFDYNKFSAHGNYIKLSLTPLKDIHLNSNRQRELGANGNIRYIYIFSAIAVFILLLACINFMNLSTARSANRAREVGVRKVLGSQRRHLVAQFLTESLTVTFTAAIMALIIAWLLLPFFNRISDKDISINLQTFTWLLPALLAIIAVVGVLSGTYPAFFLSSFRPVNVLKGKLSTGFKSGNIRSILVVFQFGISIFLIIGTLVIYNQLRYIQNKDLGFNRNQVLIVKNASILKDPKILKQEIKQLPGVVDATLTSFLPTGTLRFPNVFDSSSGEKVQGEYWTVDDDYIPTMGMKLVSGRNFSSRFATDSSAMVINQTAARMLGYSENPAEKVNGKYHIIGVVKDFNFSSLRDNVTPLAMVMAPDWMACLSIRVNTNNLPATMRRIQDTWTQLAPNQQFEYSFMDDDFNALYRSEISMGELFIVFTTLAIIIACLGLFGLAAYAAEQRSREISIRKILGASVSGIVSMLSGDFIKLVSLAVLISSPLAWLVMRKWLQGFAYRENIHWWVFAATAFASLLIAFITISFQSIKAARANPADCLRGE